MRVRLLAGLAGGALLLTACGADDGDETPDVAAPVTDVTDEVQPDDEPAADDTDDDAQDELAGCAVGTWSVDNDLLREEYDQTMSASGLTDVTTEISGDLHLDLAEDGTYVLTAGHHRMAVEGESPAGRVAVAIEHDGTESGGWTTGDGTLVIDGEDSSGLTTVGEMTMGGVTLPADDLPVSSRPWAGTMTATCDADRLVVVQSDELEEMTVEFRRVG